MVSHALVLHPVCWIRWLHGESVKEDAPKIAQEEGECAAGSNEASAAHGGGLVEDGGRNLEADAVLDVVQAAVVVVPHLGSTLLLRGEFHTLPAVAHLKINCLTPTVALIPRKDWHIFIKVTYSPAQE